jgi:hypothetical protein
MNEILKNEISEYKLKCNRDAIRKHVYEFVSITLSM